MSTRALHRCPECRRAAATFMHHGRRLFAHHTKTATRGPSLGAELQPDWCTGSGWIVEAEDRLPAASCSIHEGEPPNA